MQPTSWPFGLHVANGTHGGSALALKGTASWAEVAAVHGEGSVITLFMLAVPPPP